MKKKYRFLLFLVLGSVAFAGLVWFQSNRLLRSPKVQELLIQKIQTVVEGSLSYQGIEVGFFPQPVVTLKRPQLSFSNNPLIIEAEKLRFDFDIFPMSLGRAEPSGIYVIGGKADTRVPWLPFFGELALRNFTLKMGALRSNLAVPIQFESDAGDKKRAVSLKGHFIAPSAEKLDWNKMQVHFLADLRDLPLLIEQMPAAGTEPVFHFKNGALSAALEVKKKPGNPSLEISANGKAGGISYEVLQEKTWTTPPALDAAWDFSGEWNSQNEELNIRKMNVQLPFGNLDVNGGFRFGTGEITKLHFSASNMVLENFLKYWPRLEEALPFHIGFSGPTSWVLSLEGTFDHLSFHLNLDLAQTLLTYGTYFTKPKNIPLVATLDFLIQKGETLSGDFSIRFQEMSLKGNLTDLDIASGVGQLNLLTNKFSVKGWEWYVPAFRNYKLEGNAKILADWKGDLRRLEKAEQIFHVTVEKGNWTDLKGAGIKNANLSFDYSPLMIEGRDMQFDIGGAPIMADFKITNLMEKPEIQGRIASGELDPRGFWSGVKALLQNKKDPAEVDIYDHVDNSILALFPKGQVLKDVTAEVHSLAGVWDLPKLHALVYDGTLDAKGSLDLTAQPAKYKCEGEVRGMDLNSFLNRSGSGEKLFEGALSLKFNLEGMGWGKQAWAESLKGLGRFTLTGGRSPVFDITKPLSMLEPFAGIGDLMQDPDSFEQVDCSWNLADGKFSTGDLLIKSADHIVDGEGTMDFDGIVNFRWDVFLSTALAADLFPDMASTFRKKTKAHLGPVPVLVSGMVAAPDLKPDFTQVEDLLRRIEQQRAKDLLYELVLN